MTEKRHGRLGRYSRAASIAFAATVSPLPVRRPLWSHHAGGPTGVLEPVEPRVLEGAWGGESPGGRKLQSMHRATPSEERRGLTVLKGKPRVRTAVPRPSRSAPGRLIRVPASLRPAAVAAVSAVALALLVCAGAWSEPAPTEPLLSGELATVDASAGQADALAAGVKLFVDRDYLAGGDVPSARPLPPELDGKPFLPASLSGGLVAVCREPGVVYVLTPAREVNPDSREEVLATQGFRRAAVPVFPLFGAGQANRCVVYQKRLSAGDRLEFGKWAVLIARLGTVNRAVPTSYTARRTSMITNHPIMEDGKPVAWPDLKRPPVESVYLYRPETEWTYSHHPHLAVFGGRFYALWSNGRSDEDAPGQRVLLARGGDFTHWAEPQLLASPPMGPDGQERVLTAGGFHHHEGTLVAYFCDYGPRKETTRLLALTTTDGENWSAPRDLGIPVCPNHGPQRTASGRLVICGNISFPYTKDPTGLAGWRMSGIYPPEMAGTSDDPASFWGVAKRQGWPAALCEGSFYQTDDGVLHALLRSTGDGFRWRLWVTESRDDGVTWSEPAETAFSDCDAKFHLGRLPDGRFYYVGNPLAGGRNPLVLSLSRDGVSFDQHYILGDEHYAMRRKGQWKGGDYGYPHTLVHEGYLHVIVSRQKEAVAVLRVALGEL